MTELVPRLELPSSLGDQPTTPYVFHLPFLETSTRSYRDPEYSNRETLLKLIADETAEIAATKKENECLEKQLRALQTEYDQELNFKIACLKKYSPDPDAYEDSQRKYKCSMRARDLRVQLEDLRHQYEVDSEFYSETQLHKIKANVVELNHLIEFCQSSIENLEAGHKKAVEYFESEELQQDQRKLEEKQKEVSRQRIQLRKLTKQNQKLRKQIQDEQGKDEEMDELLNELARQKQRLKSASFEHERKAREPPQRKLAPPEDPPKRAPRRIHRNTEPAFITESQAKPPCTEQSSQPEEIQEESPVQQIPSIASMAEQLTTDVKNNNEEPREDVEEATNDTDKPSANEEETEEITKETVNNDTPRDGEDFANDESQQI